MRGSMSQADATFVSDPPHTTTNGVSVSSRSASLTIASAAAVSAVFRRTGQCVICSGYHPDVAPPGQNSNLARCRCRIADTSRRPRRIVGGHLATDDATDVNAWAQQMVRELDQTIGVSAIVIVRNHPDARANCTWSKILWT